MDLYSSCLYAKVKITQPDGSDLTEENPIASLNLFSKALFSQIDVSVNEKRYLLQTIPIPSMLTLKQC